MLHSDTAPKTYDALLMGIDMTADMSDRLSPSLPRVFFFFFFLSPFNLGHGLTVSELPDYLLNNNPTPVRQPDDTISVSSKALHGPSYGLMSS